MTRKGRPSKYNNPETKEKLQELVFLYRKENPSGIIRIANMVRFSKEMSDKTPLNFLPYDKDVWGTYGREFIEQANEPLRNVYETDENEIFEVPNVSDIVEKYHHNKSTLLSYLIPIEKMVHDTLLRESKKNEKMKELETDNEVLKSKLKEKEELVRKYEEFVLQMAHHSYIHEYQDKFGLTNQISVNANKRNKDAMRHVDDLSMLFLEENEVEVEKEEVKESAFLQSWKEKRRT